MFKYSFHLLRILSKVDDLVGNEQSFASLIDLKGIEFHFTDHEHELMVINSRTARKIEPSI